MATMDHSFYRSIPVEFYEWPDPPHIYFPRKLVNSKLRGSKDDDADEPCNTCATVDFKQLLEQEPEWDAPRVKWPTRRLPQVKSAMSCPYCRFSLYALGLDSEAHPEDVKLYVCSGEPVLAGSVQAFGTGDWPSGKQVPRYHTRFNFFLCDVDSVIGPNPEMPGTGTWIIDRKALELRTNSFQRLAHDCNSDCNLQVCMDEKLLCGRRYHETVDFNVVKQWLELSKGAKGPVEMQARIRLIDLQSMNLVDGLPHMQYAALSYVWGGVTQAQLVVKNSHQLKEQTGLQTISKNMPRTVTDAMHVCKQVGVRYLWVDALCIVQDDEADKAVQIRQMLLVYKSALMTIVNASGGDNVNADSPLPGVLPGSRTINQNVCSGLILTERRPFHHIIRRSKWYSRGWTFQELLGSRAALYFTNQQVFMRTNDRFFCEDTIFEHLDPSIAPDITYNVVYETFDQDPYSSELDEELETLCTWLQNYSIRSLTYDEDALAAIEGLLSGFAPFVDGRHNRLLWGMATCAFDFLMLWDNAKDYPLRRRSQFPSWSWAGWAGVKSFGIGNYHSVDGLREMISPYLYVNSIVDPESSVYSMINERFGFCVGPCAISADIVATHSRTLQFKTSYHRFEARRIKNPNNLQPHYIELDLFYPGGDPVKSHSGLSENILTVQLPVLEYERLAIDTIIYLDFITIRTAPSILRYQSYGDRHETSLADFKRGDAGEWPLWLMCVKIHKRTKRADDEMLLTAERIAVVHEPIRVKEWVGKGAEEVQISLS